MSSQGSRYQRVAVIVINEVVYPVMNSACKTYARVSGKVRSNDVLAAYFAFSEEKLSNNAKWHAFFIKITS